MPCVDIFGAGNLLSAAIFFASRFVTLRFAKSTQKRISTTIRTRDVLITISGFYHCCKEFFEIKTAIPFEIRKKTLNLHSNKMVLWPSG